MSRRFVVTGSAAGIGRATATLLRERGDTVIGVDLRDAEVVADLATAEGRAEAVAEVGRQCGGPLDGLVTCAGVSQAGVAQASVNYFGTTEVVTGLQPLLAAAEAPRVALVGSISGTQPHDADLVAAMLAGDGARTEELAGAAVQRGRGHEIYSSSKTALARWMRRVCTGPQWAGAGIPVNAVAPGVVLTEMTAGLIADPQWKQIMDEAVPMPLHGYAEPTVIAHALAWLLAPENTHMTGQVIYVDGGAEASLRPDDTY